MLGADSLKFGLDCLEGTAKRDSLILASPQKGLMINSQDKASSTVDLNPTQTNTSICFQRMAAIRRA